VDLDIEDHLSELHATPVPEPWAMLVPGAPPDIVRFALDVHPMCGTGPRSAYPGRRLRKRPGRVAAPLGALTGNG
jgi:hypothetical protein